MLAPLVHALRKHLLSATKIHADDTPIPVLAPGNGMTKTGRLWTDVRDDRPAGESTAPAVWFAYSEDRKGEHPQQHMKQFKDALRADAHSGFHHLYAMARSTRSHAGRMHGVSSMTFTPYTSRPSPRRPSRASALSTASRKRSAASPPRCRTRFARPVPNRCSMTCGTRWENLSVHSSPRAKPRQRSAMRSRAGAP